MRNKKTPVALPAEQTAEYKCLTRQKETLFIEDSVLKRLHVDANGMNRRQVVLPRKIVHTYIKELHTCSLGGHLGAKKTFLKAQLKYYWYGMQSDIKKWCKSCLECAAAKTTPLMPRAPLVQEKPAYPFERIAMDIVGPLTESSKMA